MPLTSGAEELILKLAYFLTKCYMWTAVFMCSTKRV